MKKAIPFALAALLALASPALSQGTTISQLPAASIPLNMEAVPLVQGGATKRAPAVAFGIYYAGNSAPSPLAPWQMWWDTSTATPTLRLWDGGSWTALGTISPALHLWTPAGMSIGLVLPSALFGAVNPAGSGGTLTASFLNVAANSFLAGPTSGAAAQPAMRAISGADLPLPTTSTPGAVESISCPSHQWINVIPTTAVQPTCAQPAAGDISGLGTAAAASLGISGATLGLLNGNLTFSGTDGFTQPLAVNLNALAAPTALTGTLLDLAQADGIVARSVLDAFGALPTFSCRYAAGTNAAKTAPTSGTEICGYNVYVWNGSAYVGPVASRRFYADENIASGHQGSRACDATTPDATTTLANVFCEYNDGGVVIGAPTGGDDGAYTLNVQGNIYINGVLVDTISAANTLTNKSIAASEINSGTLAAARLPLPTTSTPGAVESISCPSHQWINVIPTTAVQPTCAQPAAGDISGLSVASHDLLGNTTSGSATAGDVSWSAMIDANISSTQGALSYRGASGWVGLSPGNLYQLLCSGGSSANISWCNSVVTLGQSGAASSAGADTTEDTLATVTVPANSMAANGCLDIDSLWSYTNNSDTKTIRIRFSGASGSQFVNLAETATAGIGLRTKICNANATNSQIGGQNLTFGSVAATSNPLTSSNDTTAGTTVVFTGQKGVSGDTLTLLHYSVKLEPSP